MSLRVLLADESASIKKVFQRGLHDFATDVKTVQSGVDVIEVAEQFQPHIIFADILLQKVDGYEVCQKIKNHDFLHGTPFVLMWSSFMNLDLKKYESCLADGEIEKPFEVETLRNQIRNLVANLHSPRLSDHLTFPQTLTQDFIQEENKRSEQHAAPQPSHTSSHLETSQSNQTPNPFEGHFTIPPLPQENSIHESPNVSTSGPLSPEPPPPAFAQQFDVVKHSATTPGRFELPEESAQASVFNNPEYNNFPNEEDLQIAPVSPPTKEETLGQTQFGGTGVDFASEHLSQPQETFHGRIQTPIFNDQSPAPHPSLETEDSQSPDRPMDAHKFEAPSDDFLSQDNDEWQATTLNQDGATTDNDLNISNSAQEISFESFHSIDIGDSEQIEELAGSPPVIEPPPGVAPGTLNSGTAVGPESEKDISLDDFLYQPGEEGEKGVTSEDLPSQPSSLPPHTQMFSTPPKSSTIETTGELATSEGESPFPVEPNSPVEFNGSNFAEAFPEAPSPLESADLKDKVINSLPMDEIEAIVRAHTQEVIKLNIIEQLPGIIEKIAREELDKILKQEIANSQNLDHPSE